MAFIRRYLAELLLSLALLAGWTLITLAIARLWRPDVVWPLSYGLLFLSVSGWRLAARIAGDGLYALAKPQPED